MRKRAHGRGGAVMSRSTRRARRSGRAGDAPRASPPGGSPRSPGVCAARLAGPCPGADRCRLPCLPPRLGRVRTGGQSRRGSCLQAAEPGPVLASSDRVVSSETGPATGPGCLGLADLRMQPLACGACRGGRREPPRASGSHLALARRYIRLATVKRCGPVPHPLSRGSHCQACLRVWTDTRKHGPRSDLCYPNV